MTLYQIFQAMLIGQKKHGSQGLMAILSYMAIVKIKKNLLHKCQADFLIILEKYVPWETLY